MSSVRELRDSVAFSAGRGYERRSITERLRQRARMLECMDGPTPRTVVRELRRLADQIDQEPT